MPRSHRFLVGLYASVFSIATIAAQSAPALRPWTPEDSIPVRYFYNSTDTSWWSNGELPVEVAPGGGHFFVVSSHGELACDCTVGEVLIYSVKDLSRELKKSGASRIDLVPPIRKVRMSSTADGVRQNTGAVVWPKWESPTSLLIQGTGDRGKYMSLYRFDIRSGDLTRLSGEGQDVANFDARSQSVIYTVVNVRALPRDDKDVPEGSRAYPVQPLRRNALAAFLDNRWALRTMTTYAVKGRDAPWTVQDATVPPARVQLRADPSLSPDGRWGVAILPTAEQGGLPESWQGYAGLDLPMDELLSRDRERLWQFVLVDLTTGQARPMLGTPLGVQARQRASRAYWSADGERVMLFNTMLPLDEAAPERRNTPYIVEYTVRTGAWRAIAPVTESASSWGERNTRGYDLERRNATSPPALPAGMAVQIRESANDPPVIVARLGKREVALTDADPALAGLQRAEVKELSWMERDGLEEKGGLLLPNGATRPLPLVIQIEPRAVPAAPLALFRPDGGASTAFAAQALVAQGMAVLQVGGNVPGKYPELFKSQPWSEGVLMTERVDAAVAKLAADGIVDPQRVGLVGFSRTGFRVNYVITHPGKVVPAAAIVADSITQDYTDSVVALALSNGESRNFMAKEMLGGSFWDNKKNWLEHSPGFNADRIETPALFTYNGFQSAYFPFLETLAAFRANGREIDMMLFPEGGHQLQRPRQRVASMQSTVDWMSFWLLGREDAKPEKAAQYRYWRALRAQKLAREEDVRGKHATH